MDGWVSAMYLLQFASLLWVATILTESFYQITFAHNEFWDEVGHKGIDPMDPCQHLEVGTTFNAPL